MKEKESITETLDHIANLLVIIILIIVIIGSIIVLSLIFGP